MARFMGLLGIVTFLAIAWALSKERKAIHWRTVGNALVLQWIFAFVVLKGQLIAWWLSLPQATGLADKPWRQLIPWVPGLGWAVMLLLLVPTLLRRFAGFKNRAVGWCIYGVAILGMLRGNLVGSGFDRMRVVVNNLMDFAGAGASFVLGDLSKAGKPVIPIFAFVVLPTIIFVASLFAILYHLGVMQKVVGVCARAMGRLLKVSGAESVSVAASILMGQTEAPLTVRPFLSRFTRSELMTIMTAGMAHVSGSIMVAYVQIANVSIVHLLTAVIMTAPGAVMIAKIMEPETGEPATQGEVKVDLPQTDANVVDAAARGAGEGLHLALNVAGMLIAFIALVALLNGLVKGGHSLLPTALASHIPGSLEGILGKVFSPFAFLMGVPWSEASTVGQLLGKRMVLNEFVAFIDLGGIANLSAKARTISTFALCGFANLSSIAIQIGGIGALVPERRGDLARLGFRAMIAGTLANFLSACIAGILT